MASEINTTEKKIDSKIKTGLASTPLKNPLRTIESVPEKKVTLKSSDEELFEIDESVAREMVMVKNFLDARDENDPSFSCSSHEPIPLFHNVAGSDLAVIIEYLNKRRDILAKESKAKARAAVRAMGNKLANKLSLREEIKSVLLAANYLDVKEFQDVLSQNIAERLPSRTVEFVREFFGIENDFEPGEEEKIREENKWAFKNVKYDED